MRPLRILQVCAEFVPLAKVGGLGDVTAGLSTFLHARGHEVVVVVPNYEELQVGLALESRPAMAPRTVIAADGTPVRYSAWKLRQPAQCGQVYVINCPEYFAHGGVYAAGEREAQRFMLLSLAALELCEATGFTPDIIHCHDWHASPAAVLLRSGRFASSPLAGASTVLTIHNIGYQGGFPESVLRFGPYATAAARLASPDGGVNFLRAGILSADALTTVSPTHAREIQTPGFGKGLDGLLRECHGRLTGILNGVDYAQWNPVTDPLIDAHYSADDLRGKYLTRDALATSCALPEDADVPLVGFVARLTQHKGLDLVLDALPALLRERRFSAVFLGAGEPQYVAGLAALARDFPGRVAFLQAQDEHMAHRIIAGSDLLLVPSLYEPCGLTQMYALRYGTVPVVRQTGGLADTIRHFDPVTGQGNGSVFRDADTGGLAWGLSTALGWREHPAQWRQLIRNGMAEDFSWSRQGPLYEDLYASLTPRPPSLLLA